MPNETPDTRHGRLKEAAHIAGYSSERALADLEYLLEGGKWKKLSDGFKDVNEFLDSIKGQFSDIRILADRRKKIVKLLEEQQPDVQNTKIAGALGASHVTIGRDRGTVTDVHKAPDSPQEQPPIGTFVHEPAGDQIARQVAKTTETKRAQEARRAQPEPAAEWPEGQYRIIYADPPWSYGTPQHSKHEQASVLSGHYPSMTVDELCDLSVSEMAMPDSVLFLWATSPLIRDAFRVMDAWDFTYKASFVWDKVLHNVGHYNSVRHEFLLIGTRGSCLPDSKTLIDSVVSIERTEHSVKPDRFREIIDEMYPNGPRIELFARGKYAGWDTWGNEEI